MRYVYFTKTLQKLDLQGIASFLKEIGCDGADLAVRPGYPVNPENALAELPAASKLFQSEGLSIGLISSPTSMNDAGSRMAQQLFDACGRASVPAIKIGYFPYQGAFEKSLGEARRRLAAFAELAKKTGVRVCYHTHSGNNLGNNAAGLRLLLQDLDPHNVGAFLDTGHVAVNGGPIRLELDMIRPWLSLVAIKDMIWRRGDRRWEHQVVPAGDGIVRWDEVAQGLRNCGFNGTISLHAEYEAKDLNERKALAVREREFLQKQFASSAR